MRWKKFKLLRQGVVLFLFVFCCTRSTPPANGPEFTLRYDYDARWNRLNIPAELVTRYRTAVRHDTLFLTPHIPYIAERRTIIRGYPYSAPPFQWQFPRLTIKNTTAVKNVRITVLRCKPAGKSLYYIRHNQQDIFPIGFRLYNFGRHRGRTVVNFGLAAEPAWTDLNPALLPKPYKACTDSLPVFINLKNHIAPFQGTDMRIIAYGDISAGGKRMYFKTRIWLEQEESGVPGLPEPGCGLYLPQQIGESIVYPVEYASDGRIYIRLCSPDWMKYLLHVELLYKERTVMGEKYIHAEIFVPK